MYRNRISLAAFVVAVVWAVCSHADQQTIAMSSTGANKPGASPAVATGNTQTATKKPRCKDFQAYRKALFGDLHVHTALSFDAVAKRLNLGPEDAYRYARGEAIPFFSADDSSGETTMRLDQPLDFVAVTDHSESLGDTALCTTKSSAAYASEFCRNYRSEEWYGTLMLASQITQTGDVQRAKALCGESGEICVKASKGPWQRMIAAAENNYDRSDECSFTTFIGYEHTATPGNSNMHRNVIFATSKVPEVPVTYMEAPKDYQLWGLLDKQCRQSQGCDYITIPHNSNLSNGKLLIPYSDLEPTTANKKSWAGKRLRREPLMEIFQHKGTSECMNGFGNVLGAPDELCDIEQVRRLDSQAKVIQYELRGTELYIYPKEETPLLPSGDCGDGTGQGGMFNGGCVSANDFLRPALLSGMEEQQAIGLNPVKLGVIASTDGHTASPGSVREDTWKGYVTGEMASVERLQEGTLPSGIRGNPGGLAGVWAEENTRESIFAALRRREVFGTSGPRIVPRFFGGWDYPSDICERRDWVETGYRHGVAMGGDLPASPAGAQYPTFVLAATRDPAPFAPDLAKLQVIKGWIDKTGEKHVEVLDIAGEVTAATEQSATGHKQLCAVYTDKSFRPGSAAYYYLRAVSVPSPRWSYYDCLTFAKDKKPEVCRNMNDHITREMAWSSPIWYSPE